jgi:5-methylcytosine-specific restriction endonuclease McrA
MGKRQRKWARKVRLFILDKLGGKCAKCGTTENLELDTIIPTGHTITQREQSQLACHYRRQLKENNLQILCKKHNRQKSDKIPF